MKAIADKMEVFQNKLAGRAYKDMTRSVDQIGKMRHWPFGRKSLESTRAGDGAPARVSYAALFVDTCTLPF